MLDTVLADAEIKTVKRVGEVVPDEVKQGCDACTLVCCTAEYGNDTVVLETLTESPSYFVTGKGSLLKELLDEIIGTFSRIFNESVSEVLNDHCILFRDWDGYLLATFLEFICLVLDEVDDTPEFLCLAKCHYDRHEVALELAFQGVDYMSIACALLVHLVDEDCTRFIS